jgi:D-alanine-D-alanine ligase-like ATP-grasp enzyme
MTPTSLVPKAAKAMGISFPDLVEKITYLAIQGE